MPPTDPRQFQHFIQASYLRQWSEPSGVLNVFDKVTRKPLRRRSHNNSCGAYNWQSAELEKAYHHVEAGVNVITGQQTQATQSEARLLTTWLALHHVRTPRNREALAKGYDKEVTSFQHWLSGCGAFYQIFQGKFLMTSGSPICIISSSDELGPLDFVIAPLSPSKAIYITPNDRLPGLKGSNAPLFGPDKLNQAIAHYAYSEIISFDRQLHLPPQS